MNKMMILMLLLVSLSAEANIEAGPLSSNEPTTQEISIARGCFEALEVEGCRHPREDHQQFRSCLRNVISTLPISCQKKMLELYGN